MDFIPKDIEEYCLDHSDRDSKFYGRLVEETNATEEILRMLSGPMVGNVLQLFVRLLKAKLAVDVGTFTGYSALKMAEVMESGGEVITIDVEENKLAEKYFENASWGDRIHKVHVPAAEALNTIEGPADLIFIDADKGNYPLYYEKAVELVRPGGLILLDNTLWSGRVLNPDDVESKALAETNDLIQKDDRVLNQLLPIRDGLTVAFRL